MRDLEEPWLYIRAQVTLFEHALALIPSGATASLADIQRSSDSIVRSALRQALVAITDLERAIPSAHRAFILCLIGALCRRVDASEVKLDVYTRLALWERVWISLTQSSTASLSSDERWARCVEMSSAISRIGWHLRQDPLWSPAHVLAQRDAFEAEEILVELINHQTESTLTATIAPLDTDILHGLDFSVCRAEPAARGWIQFSTSAEESLNRQKLKKLKRSAAVTLLSPWTLARHLRALSPERRDRFWDEVGEEEPHQHIAQSRAIARILTNLCHHVNGNMRRPQARPLRPKDRAFLALITHFLGAHLGRRAARSHRPRRGWPPLATGLDMEVRQLLASIRSPR